MVRKTYTPEQIINKLREAEIHINQGIPKIGITEQTYKNGEGGLEFSVTDTGDGIATEDLPHVFERFYRSGSSRTRKEGGTGLGLAIVKQMVEAHGGNVRAESKVGKGSIFSILLPFSI